MLEQISRVIEAHGLAAIRLRARQVMAQNLTLPPDSSAEKGEGVPFLSEDGKNVEDPAWMTDLLSEFGQTIRVQHENKSKDPSAGKTRQQHRTIIDRDA